MNPSGLHHQEPNLRFAARRGKCPARGAVDSAPFIQSPNLCLILPVTRLTWATDTRPSFEASDASIVAILALRMREGTGQTSPLQVGDRHIVGPASVLGAGNHDDPQESVQLLELSRSRPPGPVATVASRGPCTGTAP